MTPWRPGERAVQRGFARLRGLQGTCPLPDATTDQRWPALPTGWHRVDVVHELGRGDGLFAAACAALDGWRQFATAWTAVARPEQAIEPGSDQLVFGRSLGLWSVAPMRICRVEEEPCRYGYAIVTLPGHPMCGEELFRIEHDHGGRVCYRIRSCSRPGSLLGRLALPLVRQAQRRFGREVLQVGGRAEGGPHESWSTGAGPQHGRA